VLANDRAPTEIVAPIATTIAACCAIRLSAFALLLTRVICVHPTSPNSISGVFKSRAARRDVRALLILRRVFPLHGRHRDAATNAHLISWLIDFRLTASRLLCRARA
jgi:hypothetical protein